MRAFWRFRMSMSFICLRKAAMRSAFCRSSRLFSARARVAAANAIAAAAAAVVGRPRLRACEGCALSGPLLAAGGGRDRGAAASAHPGEACRCRAAPRRADRSRSPAAPAAVLCTCNTRRRQKARKSVVPRKRSRGRRPAGRLFAWHGVDLEAGWAAAVSANEDNCCYRRSRSLTCRAPLERGSACAHSTGDNRLRSRYALRTARPSRARSRACAERGLGLAGGGQRTGRRRGSGCSYLCGSSA